MYVHYDCKYRYHQIEPMDQLLLTLRFYATGSFYVVQADFIGIYKTTAGRIIKRITQALLTLTPRYIKFPDTEQGRRRLQLDFLQIANFPRVCGAIDCTHIKIKSPGSAHDSHIFENSNIIRRLQHGEFDDLFLLGDSGYSLFNFIMTPIANPVTHAQEAYNRSHIRTRYEM